MSTSPRRCTALLLFRLCRDTLPWAPRDHSTAFPPETRTAVRHLLINRSRLTRHSCLFWPDLYLAAAVRACGPSAQKEQWEPVDGSKGPGLKVGCTQVMKRTYWTSRDQTLLIFQSTFKVIASLFVNQRVMHFWWENKGASINYYGFSYNYRGTCTFGYF